MSFLMQQTKLSQETNNFAKNIWSINWVITNYNIIVEKNENPKKKKYWYMYAHWQMLFKSISSATYVSLQIALKKR